MRRPAVLLAGVTSGVVLVLSYRASAEPGAAAVVVAAAPRQPAASAPPPPPSVAPGPSPTPSAPPPPTGAAPRPPTRVATTTPRPPAPAPVTSAAPPPAPLLFTGGVAQTPYGPVQVQITVSGGRITQARAVQAPSGASRSVALSSYAVPRLDQETLAAQSAHIDVVSGATYTSEGYIGSLQSALDAAHLR